jgi:hypothetical protein
MGRGPDFAGIHDMVRGRRRFADAIAATGSVCVVVAGISAIDDDVRGFLVNVFTGDRVGDVEMISNRVYSGVGLVFPAVGNYYSAHTPLVLFALAALALVTFMLRT